MKTDSIDLFILADSLGWTQVQRRAFMADFFPFRAPCDTVFGDSAACDSSILTGFLPARHGHFSPFVFDPRNAPFPWAGRLGWIPHPLAALPPLRAFASRRLAASHDFTGDFQLRNIPFSRLPWFDYTEKHDSCSPGGNHGGQPPIFEHWENSCLPWMRSHWRLDDAANVASLGEEIHRGELRLAWLGITGLGATMRAHGSASPHADATFARFEGTLRDLRALAQSRYREVRIHLFGNHGITDTRAVSRMMVDFEKAGFSFPRDYAAAWDSTMARFWFPGGDAIREQICDWLRRRPEGRLLTQDELESWGCNFPGNRYGDIFYLLDSGTLFAPSFMNSGSLPAVHGFDPAEPESRACWLTSHPSGSNPSQIHEIYHVMHAVADRLSAALSISRR